MVVAFTDNVTGLVSLNNDLGGLFDAFNTHYSENGVLGIWRVHGLVNLHLRLFE